MRKKLMGGGMMGRRMGYSQGSSKGKVPTTPKEKSLAKLAPPKDKITFGDVVAGRTKGKRMQAKDGTIPFNKQKNIIDKQGKRGIIVGTGTMEASPKVKTTKRRSDRLKKQAFEQKQKKEGRIIGNKFYPKMAKGGKA